MTPSERVMPVTVARWSPLDRAWIVELPGGIEIAAWDESGVEALRARYASGSALRFVRDVLRGESVEPDGRRQARAFWEKLDYSSECWIWPRKRDPDGYGELTQNGRSFRAHRVAWEMTNGPIPAGMFVLHTCDNPPCCNPAHLFIGTHADNMRDRDAKGRGPRRASNPSAKLTEADVAEVLRLRSEGVRVTAIAARYGVHRSTIYQLLAGTTWGSDALSANEVERSAPPSPSSPLVRRKSTGLSAEHATTG